MVKSSRRLTCRPISDGVLVERLDPEITTPGGIVLPDQAKEKPCRGIVIATGPGKLLNDGTRADMEVMVGDEVIFGQYSGQSIEVDSERYQIMRESEVFVIVEPE